MKNKLVLATIVTVCLLFHTMTVACHAENVPMPMAAGLAPDMLQHLLQSRPIPDFEAGAKLVEPPRGRKVILVDGPRLLNEPDTEYRLTRDVVADGTAFRITAHRITLNLNGHTVTYNQKVPGHGVHLDNWWLEDVAIVNGAISQGSAKSGGGYHAFDASPIKTTHCRRLVVAGVTIQYAGPSMIGIYVDGGLSTHLYNNTFIDEGTEVTNRHAGVEVVKIKGDGSKIHNNLVKRARHIGFRTGANSDIYDNEVHVDSCVTNSTAITAESGLIHRNRIFGQGVHPIGVWPGKTMKIYDNYIKVQSTRSGGEYGSTGAACIRMMWGENFDIEVSRNTMILVADQNYQGKGFNSWGRCVWVGARTPNQKIVFSDNLIIAYNTDGKAKAASIAISNDAENKTNNNILFQNNVIASNWSNLLLSDNYGHADGYTRFVGNRIIRLDKHASYLTVRSQYSTIPSTAVLIANSLENGASFDLIDMEFSGAATKELVFGWRLNAAITDAGKPLAGARVQIIDNVGATVFDGVSDQQGNVAVDLVAYLRTNQTGINLPKSGAVKMSEKGSRVDKTPHTIRISSGERIIEKNISLQGNTTLEIAF